MKKNFKSFLASAMAMVMTVSLLPASVLAATVKFVGSEKTVSLDTYEVDPDAVGFYFNAKDTTVDFGPYKTWNDTELKALIDGEGFEGWSFTKGGEVLTSEAYWIDRDTNLYAIYKSVSDPTPDPDDGVTKYTVTFDANGGTGTMDSITVTAGEDGKFWVTLPECGFTAPDGKFFSGYWLFDLSNTWERGYVGVERELTGNVTLYAQWTDKFHTVTYYDVNRGNTFVVENIEHGSEITMPTYEEMFGALPANTWMIEWHPVDMDLTFAPSVGDSYTVTSDERIYPAVGTVNVYPDGFIVDAKGNVVKTNANVKADFTDGKLGLELVDCKDYTDANVDHWNIYSRNWATTTYELISKKEGIELPRFDVYVQAVLKAPSSDNNDSGYEGGGSSGGSSSSGSSSSSDSTTNSDGSTTTTTTNKDGSVTEKTTFEDGSKSEITVNKDGSAEFKAEMKDGTTANATIAADGKVEAEVELSDKATFEAAKNNEVLPLPIPSVPVTTSRDEASVITISASDDYATKVEVPVENVTPGTVVILVDKNGKETIVTKSSVTKDGVVFATQGDVTVKIVDNSKSFGDVKSNFWGNNSVAFVTSRELFSGTSADSFSPNEPMTRAMIFTVLARLDGQDPTGGANWWDKGMDWAKSVGLTDGSNPQAQLTREQLAVMLYNYSGKPAVDTSKLDKAGVSNWAENAMAWCVSQGVMAGDQNGNLNAGNNATRAEVATMLMSFVSSNNR